MSRSRESGWCCVGHHFRLGRGWLEEHHACPPSQYSCLHIWAPTAYRAYAYVQKTGTGRYGLDVVPRDRLGNQPVPFPCPGVNPAAYPYGGLFPTAGIVPFPPEDQRGFDGTGRMGAP